jgi:hypothetical protein
MKHQRINHGLMTRRTCFTVPAHLLSQMRAYKDVNWSQVVSEAIEAQLQGLAGGCIEERLGRIEEILEYVFADYAKKCP